MSNTGDNNFGITGIKTYLIQVLVKPGKALFEFTLRSFDNERYQIISHISTINRYGNQSSLLETYCYCNHLL
jgi:hypothetical protein